MYVAGVAGAGCAVSKRECEREREEHMHNSERETNEVDT